MMEKLKEETEHIENEENKQSDSENEKETGSKDKRKISYEKPEIDIKEGIRLDKLKNRFKNEIKLQKKDLDLLDDEEDKDLITTNIMDLQENQRLFDEEIEEKMELEENKKNPKKEEKMDGWARRIALLRRFFRSLPWTRRV